MIITKPVITISEQELPVLAKELLERMLKSGFVPDAALGIATGGAFVVEAFPSETDLVRFTCTVTRPSTAAKKRFAIGSRILKRMPYGLTNPLRVLEDRLGERSAPVVSPAPPDLEASLDAVCKMVAERDLRNIAVIDDAVDSGATLACVTTALKMRLPARVTMRTGVITRTRSPEKTAIQPDFYLFENTLCRFHWSEDYKAGS